MSDQAVYSGGRSYNAIWALPFSPNQKLVLSFIANCTHVTIEGEQSTWRMSWSYIVERVGLGRTTIYAVLKELEESGFVEVIGSKRADGSKDWNTYGLTNKLFDDYKKWLSNRDAERVSKVEKRRGGSSPAELGVVRHVNEGSSPAELQYTHTKHTHIYRDQESGAPSASAAHPSGKKVSKPKQKTAGEEGPKPVRQPNGPRQVWEAMRDEAMREHAIVLDEPTPAEYANLARVVKHGGLEKAIVVAKSWVKNGDKWTKDARWPSSMLYTRWSSIASRFGKDSLGINDPARWGCDENWEELCPVKREEAKVRAEAIRKEALAAQEEENRKMAEDPTYVPF